VQNDKEFNADNPPASNSKCRLGLAPAFLRTGLRNKELGRAPAYLCYRFHQRAIFGIKYTVPGISDREGTGERGALQADGGDRVSGSRLQAGRGRPAGIAGAADRAPAPARGGG
jgi:hypothetical protein